NKSPTELHFTNSVASVWPEVGGFCNSELITTNYVRDDPHFALSPVDANIYPRDLGECPSANGFLVKDGSATFKSASIICPWREKYYKYDGDSNDGRQFEVYCIDTQFCSMCNASLLIPVEDCPDCTIPTVETDSLGCSSAK
ncbi:hypothetical protein PFISCL1PPCAC_411, partial [Pristionchus fissidentatus]